MLVTFHCEAWGNVTMFGEVAISLLKMAGHSGTIPGALLAADIAPALARLEKSIAAAAPEQESAQAVRPDAEGEDAEQAVGLRLRAYPLVQMLSAAAKKQCDVMWEKGAPLV